MYLEFWGAAREVTGSCFLLKVRDKRILVDCGLIQGGAADEARNREPFPFNPERIDAVVLTHAHLDHSGRLPLLVNAGFKGPIYTHAASRDLCRIMLRDAAYINEKEAEWTNRKRLRKGLEPVPALYTIRDASVAMRRFRTVDYGDVQEILPGIRIRLNDAGHILGSAILEVWLEENGRERKLVFSGDLGHRRSPILREPTRIQEADLVVMESTYGDRLHRSWEDTWAELGAVLHQAHADKGNILIPAFAVGRTQELLYEFGRHYDDWGLDRWQVFLDSPLAIEATDIYARHAELYDMEATAIQKRTGNPLVLPNLHISRTALQSMGLNNIRNGALIIAGSGMCNGGRIRHHFKHNLWRRNCHVLIVGFQARGTLGRRLVDGAQYVRLWGETVRVAAKIHTIGGFSAHADQSGLMAWYQGFEGRPKVALVHGEDEPMAELARKLGEEMRAEVMMPVAGTRYDL